MKHSKVSRRMFLTGSGGYMLAIPILPSLLPRVAWSQTVASPKRFIGFITPYGTAYENWYPTVGATNILGAAADNVRERTLESVAGDISVILNSPLTPFKQKLLLLRGLDLLLPGGHNPAVPLVAASTEIGSTKVEVPNISLDQALRNSSKMNGTKFASLHLTLADPASFRNKFSFAQPGGPGTAIVTVPVIYDPRIAFDQLFGGMSINLSEAEKAARVTRNLTVVDRVFNRYKEVVNHRRISSLDKERLESHISHLHELDKRLRSESTGSSCLPPGQPPVLTTSITDLPQRVTNQIDIIVAALRCDLTRVVTLGLGDSLTYSRLMADQTSHHHSMTHSDDTGPGITNINKWWSGKFGELLSKLQSVQEDPIAGKSLLDNSLVMWANNQTSYGPLNHTSVDLPVLLAGGAGVMKMGRYVDYRRPGIVHPLTGITRGRPYNQVLVSIMQSLGLTRAEYEVPGKPGFGDYGDIFGRAESKYDVSDTARQNPLPGILV
jgi:hypothetical protein